MDHTLFRFANVSAVGQLEFEGVAATKAWCDDGYALDMSGGDISRFTDGKGALLLEHNSQIVGTCTLRKAGKPADDARKFTTQGISETADQARRLIERRRVECADLLFLGSTSPCRSPGVESGPSNGRLMKFVMRGRHGSRRGCDARALSEMLARSGKRLSC